MTKTVVGIGDYKTLKGSSSITTFALGSCVGICLYDSFNRVGGMAHILLPNIPEGFTYEKKDLYKYPELAIKAMYDEMLMKGALKLNIVAKIAGGAAMFETDRAAFCIGQRNIVSVQKVLADLNIRTIASDVGSDYGRTIEFYLETGDLHVRSMFRGNKVI